MVVRRGDIWWAELEAPTGSEPGYRRPVLVVQADVFNASPIPTVIFASLTSNLRLADAPGNLRLSAGDAGLPKPSVVNVSQLGVVSRRQLTERCGRLTASQMRAVDDGLRLALDLT